MDLSTHPFVKAFKKKGGNDKFRKEHAGKFISTIRRDDPEAYLNMCRWIFEKYTNGGAYISPGGVCKNNSGGVTSTQSGYTVSELRRYSMDQQGIQRYIDIIEPPKIRDKIKQAGGTLRNINYKPPSIAAPIISIVEGKFEEVMFEVEVSGMDLRSRKERARKKGAAAMAMSPEMMAAIQETGKRPSGMVEIMGVKTPEELEIAEKMGGMRLQAEVEMDACIDISLELSDYNAVVSEQLKRDFIDLGIAATISTCDPVTRVPCTNYVDIEGLVIPPSNRRDFNDMSWQGLCRFMSIHELRAEVIDELDANREGGVEDETLYEEAEEIVKAIVKQSRNNMRNKVSTGSEWGGQLQMLGKGDTDYDDEFKVLVMDTFFIANEVEEFVVGVHKRSQGTVYKRVRQGAKIKEVDRRRRGVRKHKKAFQHVYRALWVVGTDILVKYGVEYGTVRAGKNGQKSTRLPISVYSTQSPSIVARIIPYIDDIALDTYRKRDALSKVIPAPGIAIDISRIQPEIVMNGQTFKFDELLGLAYISGTLIYQSIPELGQGSTQGKPIEPITNTAVIEMINMYMTNLAQSMNEIRKATGISEGVDATAPSDMAVGVLKGLEVATNQALKPIFMAYRNLTHNTSKYLMVKWQTILHGGDISTEYLPIAGNGANITSAFTNELSAYEFGLAVRVKATDDERRELMQFIVEGRNAGMLPPEDYLVLRRKLREGKTREVEFYLAVASMRFRQELQQQELEKIQTAAESNAKATQSSAQAETMKIDADTKGKAYLIELKANLELRNQRELLMIQTRADGEIKGAIAGAQMAERMDANEQPMDQVAQAQ